MEISRKYAVTEKVGQGGMGVVYKVRHITLDTTLALKVLPHDFTENAEMLTRFYREARLMARLKHPNIVQVLDIDRDEALNFHYFVMEFIQGKTLRQYLRDKGGLPLAEVLHIASQVAKALVYAHTQVPSVIHRDIKPANIMIEDHTGRIVVMDFGIAKEIGQSDATRTGAIMGTMKYCAPEQMRREPVDGAADLYALGMVMYEAYTGKQFFAGLDEAAIVGKVLYEPQEHIADFSRETPPVFTAVVTKAIAKSRERRYQTAEHLLRDLEQCRMALEAGTLKQLSLPGLEYASPLPDHAELEDIEQRLFRLKGERDQRLATTLKQQVQQVRERAAAVAAGQWAATVWQQAVAHEERGQTHLQRREYQQAYEAYQEALPLFTQAHETAQTTVTFQQAEQARTAAETSREEAEQTTAQEPARTLYQRGLASQARADELWEQHAYQDAAQAYIEARQSFADARASVPQETHKQEVHTVRVSSGKTKDLATPLGTLPPSMQDDIDEDQWEIGEEKSTDRQLPPPKVTVPPRTSRIPSALIGLGTVAVVGVALWWVGLFPFVAKAPPVLTRVEPQEETLHVTAGEELTFAAEVTGAPPLHYRWLLGEQPVSQQERWVYRPPIGEETDQAKRVRVQITDANGQQVEKAWRVTVTRANQPPQLLSFAPTPDTIELAEGTTQIFQIEANDPEGEPLSYTWILDGTEAGTQPSFEWKAQVAGGHQLRAVVSDQKGSSASREWQVAVLPPPQLPEPEKPQIAKNAPPQITHADPDSSVVVAPEGTTLTFSTTATDPDGDKLTYEWSVDGKKVSRSGTSASPTLSWKAQGTGNHQVRAVVGDRGGLTAAQEWQVAVLAPSTSSTPPLPLEPSTPASMKNAPPEITVRVPDENTVKMTEGATVTLSATAIDPDGEELLYEWLVNGKKVASDATFSFTAESPGVRRVEVRVTDPRGGKGSARWDIQVEARPPTPQLVMFTPHENRHVLYDHLSRFFGVEVEVPGVPEPELRYEWKVNGNPVAGHELFEFKNQPIGTHRVEVAVLSVTGERVMHQWTVQVRADEADRPSIWAPRLEIVELDNALSKDKKIVTVSGTVRNIDEERTADTVIVWVSAIGAQGEAIARRMTLPSPQPLAPGQVATFRLQFANHDNMSDFRVEVLSK
jgi:tetratricopeptide (TPR) repeat protein